MLEKHIERRCCARVLDELGVTGYKLTSPGRCGLPDRAFLLPGGVVIMIEFKRLGEMATPLQLHVHAGLRALGFDVQVHDTEYGAFEAVKEALRKANLKE